MYAQVAIGSHLLLIITVYHVNRFVYFIAWRCKFWRNFCNRGFAALAKISLYYFKSK
jgi:hypothetical protein